MTFAVHTVHVMTIVLNGSAECSLDTVRRILSSVVLDLLIIVLFHILLYYLLKGIF